MKVEVFIIETNMQDEQFFVQFELIGPPAAISKDIAFHAGDLQALVIENELKCFSILTTDHGKVHGAA